LRRAGRTILSVRRQRDIMGRRKRHVDQHERSGKTNQRAMENYI
jgi:hypothetical protein